MIFSTKIKRKMMELSRRDLLKELYSILNKLITKKTRIEEEKEEGIRII